MRQLEIYNLEDIDELNVVTILPEGEHVIGRGVLLNCQDKRISRKHALINVSKDMVSFKAVHVNPCFFKEAKGNSMTILHKDASVTLNDGDQFALLADQFWFKVKVLMNNNNENINKTNEPMLQNTSPKNVSTEGQSTGGDHSNIPSTSKRCMEMDNLENCKRQKTTEGSVNKSPLNDLNKNYTFKEDSQKNIDSEKLITNLKSIVNEDYVSTSAQTGNQNINDNDSNHVVDNVDPTTRSMTQTEEGKEIIVKPEPENMLPQEIKKEGKNEGTNGDETKSTNTSTIYEIKSENEDGTEQNLNKQDTNVSNDPNKASCSKDTSDKQKTRRDRCWYGATCYRRNPIHRADFSHPGDDDYHSDPDDDRPVCAFGVACYRKNIEHRRQYKHPTPPAAKPSNNGQTNGKRKTPKTTANDSDSDDTESDDNRRDDNRSDDNGSDNTTGTGTRRKRRAVTKKTNTNFDSPEDDYDLEDPFINDASSDEFVLSSDEDDSTDWDDSQKVDEESQETRRLLKEAKRFTKNKAKKS